MAGPTSFIGKGCHHLGPVISIFFCIGLYIVQTCSIDYYLVHYLQDMEHIAWAAGDVIGLVLLVFCFRYAFSPRPDENKTFSIIWITWLVTQSLLAAKLIVICSTFGGDLDEEASFFGPNTLKTSIALGSCIYLLVLTSQHEAPQGSERRKYIDELTGSVVMDILDTADILDVLFDKDSRPTLSTGIPEAIIAVATINLLLPAVPLFTLSRTKFGMKKLPKRLIHLHRLLLVVAINLPNLVIRMILWHGYSVGVSPFVLKNILEIVLSGNAFYEYKKEKFERKRKHEINNGTNNGGAMTMMNGSLKEAKDEDDGDVPKPDEMPGLGEEQVALKSFDANQANAC